MNIPRILLNISPYTHASSQVIADLYQDNFAQPPAEGWNVNRPRPATSDYWHYQISEFQLGHQHTHPDILAAYARYPETPGPQPQSGYRQTVAEHVNTPLALLDQLTHEPDPVGTNARARAVKIRQLIADIDTTSSINDLGLLWQARMYGETSHHTIQPDLHHAAQRVITSTRTKHPLIGSGVLALGQILEATGTSVLQHTQLSDTQILAALASYTAETAFPDHTARHIAQAHQDLLTSDNCQQILDLTADTRDPVARSLTPYLRLLLAHSTQLTDAQYQTVHDTSGHHRMSTQTAHALITNPATDRTLVAQALERLDETVHRDWFDEAVTNIRWKLAYARPTIADLCLPAGQAPRHVEDITAEVLNRDMATWLGVNTHLVTAELLLNLAPHIEDHQAGPVWAVRASEHLHTGQLAGLPTCALAHLAELEGRNHFTPTPRHAHKLLAHALDQPLAAYPQLAVLLPTLLTSTDTLEETVATIDAIYSAGDLTPINHQNHEPHHEPRREQTHPAQSEQTRRTQPATPAGTTRLARIKAPFTTRRRTTPTTTTQDHP